MIVLTYGVCAAGRLGRMASTAPSSTGVRAAAPLRGFTSYRVIKLGKLVDAAVERALAPLGVKPRHLHVMAVIAADDTLSQQQISRLLDIDPNVMVGVIDDLEEKGLVERRRNPADRRRHVLVLTAAGRRTLRRGLAMGTAFEAELFAGLGEDGRAALDDVTAQLLDLLAPTAGEQR
jgi:DNA-binding MarR family transcriptional regulator